jgi:creatinine amidohydrolase
MASKVRYEEMLPHEIRTARTERALAYLPLGTLEWHGPQNAVGLDALKAHALCCEFADEHGGLVMPAIYWGDNRADILEIVYHPGKFTSLTRDHRPEVAEAYGIPFEKLEANAARAEEGGGWSFFEELVKRSFHQIESLGFEEIVCIAGHYPENGPAKAARDAYLAEGGACAVHVFIGYDLVADEGYRGDHAAKWETSLLWALRPDCVDASLTEVDAEEPTGIAGPHPRDASPGFGREAIARMVARLGDHLTSSRGGG